MSPSIPCQVNPPQQKRSQATMTCILDAAAHILESKTFEELTIVEVVQQAGASVGAFYGRFKDKDALLLNMGERFFEEFERQFGAFIVQPGWVSQPISVMIRDVVDFMVGAFSENQGLLRALDLKARMQSNSPFKERQQRAWMKMLPLFQDFLQQHRKEIAHPNPDLAMQMGFQQLVFTIHEIFLWGPLRQGRFYEKDELCNELVRAFLAYLEVKEAS